MALVAVVLTSPLVHVRVRGQVLASDAISASVRVHIAVLQDNRLHVLVNLGDNAWLGLVNFVQTQVLWQMDDLSALQG